MKKRMLEKYTSRYDKVPSWLMIMLSCFIAFGYFLISGFLSGIVVGIPMAIVLSFLVLNGNIQFQDIHSIYYKIFSFLFFCSPHQHLMVPAVNHKLFYILLEFQFVILYHYQMYRIQQLYQYILQYFHRERFHLLSDKLYHRIATVYNFE